MLPWDDNMLPWDDNMLPWDDNTVIMPEHIPFWKSFISYQLEICYTVQHKKNNTNITQSTI
jgi:hypothetical protein